jgi:HlyD family secretion protein
MKRRTGIVIGVVVVAVVAGAGIVARGSKPKGIHVRTEKVARKKLVSLVTANGTIEAKTKVDLSANVMGQITALNVEEGDTVHKGDLLLVIDQARYKAAVNSAQSSLQGLQAELARSREAAAQARRDFDRAAKQFHDGLLPEADYEASKSALEQAQHSAQHASDQVEQARADLAASEDELAKTEIRAPMDGVVTRRNIEKGEVVVTGTMNNPGTVLMTISDMSTVQAVLEVDQTDVPLLKLGQKAAVLLDAFPDHPFPGEVAEIGSSPILTSALGTQATGTDYEVKVTLLSHPPGIRPGLTVTADVTTATKDDVLAVPLGALVLRGADTKGTPGPAAEIPTVQPGQPEAVSARVHDVEGIYVVDGGKVDFRPVSTGIKSEMDVEITAGLKQGDVIVVGPFKALRDLAPGSRVVVDASQRETSES